MMGLVHLRACEERFGVATFSLANQAAALERISRSFRKRRAVVLAPQPRQLVALGARQAAVASTRVTRRLSY